MSDVFVGSAAFADAMPETPRTAVVNCAALCSGRGTKPPTPFCTLDRIRPRTTTMTPAARTTPTRSSPHERTRCGPLRTQDDGAHGVQTAQAKAARPDSGVGGFSAF